MFDKILAKDEFVKKFTDAGCSPEDIDELWEELLNIFYTQVLLKASLSLTPEQQKEAVGKEDVSAEELPQMFESLAKYIQENAKDIDFGKVLKDSIEESYKILEKRMGEEGKNG